MELEEFVAESLKQVLNGVVAAQKHATTLGALVSPSHMAQRDSEGKVRSVNYRSDQEHLIEFDVAITTVNSAKAGSGAGIFVGPVGIGGKGESGTSYEHVSHLRFAVPVVYPSHIEVIK